MLVARTGKVNAAKLLLDARATSALWSVSRPVGPAVAAF
jgi:hypothetical protein